ncbi:MAG: hypothetical protein IJJ65_03030, partial [Butyrivibrio sp.]|nr:hypothetical protein [Butyrivibrio sp.]
MDNIRTTIGDFRKKVLDKKNTIADKVFLVSEAARHYIENMAEAVTKQFNSKIHVTLKWENPDGPVAYASERSELHINVNNPFVTERDDRAMKLVIMKALCLHECGHLLFADFHLLNSSKKVFTDNRKLFPAPKCPEYDEWQIDAAIMTPQQIERWLMIWHRIQNSVEDGFIEWMILNIIPGDGKCLLSLREIQKADDISVKQQRQNGLKTSQIVFNLLLMLSKYGSVKMDADDKDDPAIAELLKDYDLIQKATREQRSYDRVKLINELFCKLYKFFKEEKKNEEKQKQQQSQDGQDDSNDNQSDNGSQNQSGNPNDSQEDNGADNKSEVQDSGSQQSEPSDMQSQNDSEAGSQSSEQNSSSDNPSSDCGTEKDGNTSDSGTGASSSGSSSIPDPFDIDVPDNDLNDNIDTGSGSVLNDNNINKDFDNQQAKNNKQRLEQMMNDDSVSDDAQIPTPEDKRKAESIAESIAEEEVKKDAEKDLAEQLKKEASDADYSAFNKGAKPNLTRKAPSKNAYKQFDEDYEAIKNDVKKLVNEIRNKIKDRQNGGKINALYQGRYLDNHSLYRFDQRVLCKNDL